MFHNFSISLAVYWGKNNLNSDKFKQLLWIPHLYKTWITDIIIPYIYICIICIIRQFKYFSKFPIEGDFRLGVRQYNCPPVDNSIVSCPTGNCAGIDPDITNWKLICRLLDIRTKSWTLTPCKISPRISQTV